MRLGDPFLNFFWGAHCILKVGFHIPIFFIFQCCILQRCCICVLLPTFIFLITRISGRYAFHFFLGMLARTARSARMARTACLARLIDYIVCFEKLSWGFRIRLFFSHFWDNWDFLSSRSSKISLLCFLYSPDASEMQIALPSTHYRTADPAAAPMCRSPFSYTHLTQPTKRIV